MEYITLNNGIKMPMIGLGTFLLSPADAQTSVDYALRNGYELIDTANAYINEKGVGRGIKDSGISRDKLFLETKLWPSLYEDDKQVDKTLERLGVDYIDLMILHQPSGNYVQGYRQLEKAYKQGKLKAIGLSNFDQKQLKEIMDHCEIKPAILQTECHPYYPQTELKEFLDKEKIALQCWYPLGGRGNTAIADEKIIVDLANKYKKSPVQIILRWHIQKNHIVIPGSKTPSHIDANIQIFDFSLNEEDMKLIDSLDKGKPFYIRTDEALAKFAQYVPKFED